MCPAVGGRGRVRPMCALYVLERLLHVMTHGRFVNLLAASLLLTGPPEQQQPRAPHAGGPDAPRVSAAPAQAS